MSREIATKLSPEERELEKKRGELTELEAQLVQLELDLATLQAELRTFEGRYLRSVGRLYAELDEIEAKSQKPWHASLQRITLRSSKPRMPVDKRVSLPMPLGMPAPRKLQIQYFTLQTA